VAATAPLYADRGDGRTYIAADRRRSRETSTPGGLIDGHLKLHSNLHLLDGRDLAERLPPKARSVQCASNHQLKVAVFLFSPSRRSDHAATTSFVSPAVRLTL